MKAVRQTLIAACLAASLTVMAAPAVAGGWSPHWFPGGSYPAHAYRAYYHYGAASCCQRWHRRLTWHEYYWGPRN